jgi:hypothetical protein
MSDERTPAEQMVKRLLDKDDDFLANALHEPCEIDRVTWKNGKPQHDARERHGREVAAIRVHIREAMEGW